MTDERADREDELETVEAARLRAYFDDGEPRTVTELAASEGAPHRPVEETLRSLEDAGVLAGKTVGDGENRLRVWYRPRDGADWSTATTAETGEETTTGSETAGSATAAADEGTTALDAAAAALSVPGAEPVIRDLRRDAVRAAAEFVADRGEADGETIREEVYPTEKGGYDDSHAWWEMVEPRLAELPGVERPREDEDRFRYFQ